MPEGLEKSTVYELRTAMEHNLRNTVSFLARIALVLALPLSRVAFSGSQSSGAGSPSSASASIKPFLGRWDLTIKTPKGELPSWLEISEKEGHPKVVMVGPSDHATELKKTDLKDREIEFLSPKGEEGFSDDTLFKGRPVGNQLAGTASGPNGASWHWIGRRAPT